MLDGKQYQDCGVHAHSVADFSTNGHSSCNFICMPQNETLNLRD